jgi:hypothetical protein
VRGKVSLLFEAFLYRVAGQCEKEGWRKVWWKGVTHGENVALEKCGEYVGQSSGVPISEVVGKGALGVSGSACAELVRPLPRHSQRGCRR